MKLMRALLLSTLILAAGQGTSVQFSAGVHEPPKEPPSTTLVVRGENLLSAVTTTTTIPPVLDTAVVSTASVPNVLVRVYKFNERSEQVKSLQRFLKVYVDGRYGPQTRKAHIQSLKSFGLSTTIVPKVVKPRPRYNISYNIQKRCPRYEDTFNQYGLHPVEVFSYVAWRESRCNPRSVNAVWKNGKIIWTMNKDGSYDSGLLQINSSWKSVTKTVCGADLKALLTVDCNLKVAKYLLDHSADGLGNWEIHKTN